MFSESEAPEALCNAQKLKKEDSGLSAVGFMHKFHTILTISQLKS